MKYDRIHIYFLQVKVKMEDEDETPIVEDEAEGYQCQRSECDQKFTQRSNRSRHEKKCTKGVLVKKVKTKTFTCPNSFCVKRKPFTSAFNLKRHLETCKPKGKSEYICMEPECDKSFDRLSKLARHQLKHKKPSYCCEHCFRTYSRHDMFISHVEKCNGFHANHDFNNDDFDANHHEFNATHDFDNHDFDANHHEFNANRRVFDTNRRVFDANHSFENHSFANHSFVNYSFDENHGFNVNEVFDVTNANQAVLDDRTSCVSDFGSMSINTNVSYAPGSTYTAEESSQFAEPQVYILDEHFSDDVADSVAADSVAADSVATEPTIDFESDMSHCTLAYLKSLKHQSKRSSIKLQEFGKMCVLLFAKKMDNALFMSMLADELGFRDAEEFMEFVNLDRVEVKKRGRPLSDILDRQVMYDFWKKHSEISNDRRNARHVIKIKPTKRDHAVADLVDSNVTECITKGGRKLKAQKYIYSHTTREMFQKFKIEHPEIQSSPSLFYRCKPFYISPATTREMEGCLCSKCLNPHALYSTIRRYIKNVPLSLSDYLTTFFECQKDSDINYPKLECINGTCKNGCSITDDSDKEEYDWDKRVSFYQFEMVTETYYNKKGEKTFYKRCARKDYKDVPLKDVYKLLLECAGEYLVHRHHTLLDKVFWEKYASGTTEPIVWMDYSMNIKLTEKNQVQRAHFSGRQQTLHDSLIQSGTGNTYIYHLSDDTNHDSVMSSIIIESNIIAHPEIIENGRLILRSDNCSTQYKSRYVFKALLDLAAKYAIRIDWFFGEAGHGRGLIDAMAWFGCKGPMRKEIVTRDVWFKNAKEMHTFLDEHFKDDPSKEYVIIDEEETAELRKKGREERKVNGCKGSHVMSFFPMELRSKFGRR